MLKNLLFKAVTSTLTGAALVGMLVFPVTSYASIAVGLPFLQAPAAPTGANATSTGSGGLPATGTPSGVCQVVSESGRNADAAVLLNWQHLSNHQYAPQASHVVGAMNAGIAYVSNNTGAAMLKIPGKYLNGRLDFVAHHGSPVIMAYYDPQTAVGQIWVDRAIVVNDQVVVQQMPFAPQDGILLSNGYAGNNPFWQFVQGQNGNPTVSNPAAFVKAAPNAFYAAAGMVMRYFHASRGLIATMDVTAHQTKHTSGGLLQKTTTVTVHYMAHPIWTLMLPSGTAPEGYTIGYKMPMCNAAGNLITGSTLQNAKANATVWANNQLEAGVSSMTYNGTPTGALNVYSGVEYVNQGAHPLGLDTSSWQVYQHSNSTTGLSFVGVALIAVALGALTAGAAFYAVTAYTTAGGAGGTAILGALTSVGIGGLPSAVIAGAAASGVGTLLYSTDDFGHGINWSAPYSINRNASALAGNGSILNANAQVITYNLSHYLALLHAANVSSGVSTAQHASNPNQSGGAGGVVGALTNATIADQMGAGNSLGNQARSTASLDGNTLSPSIPASVTKAYENGQAVSPYGTLPSAP
ncbi:hypothetical protein [Acidihalobacter ferrooxydans]|uniref:Uncharacterized protein n=1 Tax=Acidihalobacter ferrooxydans TaxID=1765967 RepID=A0A1P8UFJ1_9GAMM|nr:hypothetical protein [Acidihalobacter ferrooxydans]APZ42561.1 hypothetical protein BW247_05175 [Acidihalobacter ferrooxydans]